MVLGHDPSNLIGPNTDQKHLLALAERFSRLHQWLVLGGSINHATRLVSPSLFLKPLSHGPELEEFFAPVIMLQTYENEQELERLFKNADYKKHAMYLTLFGTSPLDDTLITGIHPEDTLIRDSNLVKYERGVIPYGGYGPRASCLYIGDASLPTPILPQREIFRFLIAPALRNSNRSDVSMQQQKALHQTKRDKNLTKLKVLGHDVYHNQFSRSHTIAEVRTQYKAEIKQPLESVGVSICGQVVGIRHRGLFMDIHDGTGMIRLSFVNDSDGQTNGVWTLIDLGDILGCTGKIREGDRSFLTLDVEECIVLTKSVTGDRLSRNESSYRTAFGNLVSNWRSLLGKLGFQEIVKPSILGKSNPDIQDADITGAFIPGFGGVIPWSSAYDLVAYSEKIGWPRTYDFVKYSISWNTNKYNIRFPLLGYIAYETVEEVATILERLLKMACNSYDGNSDGARNSQQDETQVSMKIANQSNKTKEILPSNLLDKRQGDEDVMKMVACGFYAEREIAWAYQIPRDPSAYRSLNLSLEASILGPDFSDDTPHNTLFLDSLRHGLPPATVTVIDGTFVLDSLYSNYHRRR